MLARPTELKSTCYSQLAVRQVIPWLRQHNNTSRVQVLKTNTHDFKTIIHSLHSPHRHGRFACTGSPFKRLLEDKRARPHGAD